MPARQCKPMVRRVVLLLLGAALVWPELGTGQSQLSRKDQLVEVRDACPGVLVELRYESARNAAGHPIYPVNARCLLRKSVAARLLVAHKILEADGMRLKVWDAYRPPAAQEALWASLPNPDF